MRNPRGAHDLDQLALRMSRLQANLRAWHGEDPRRGPAQRALTDALTAITEAENAVAKGEEATLRNE